MSMEFVKEKIIQLSLVSKDLILDSNIDIPDLFSKQFWDNFRDCILSKKAIPLKEPEIYFAYLPYAFGNIGNGDSYSFRITAKVLRSKSRGRRSNQFYNEQLQALEDCKASYIDRLKSQIKSSLLN